MQCFDLLEGSSSVMHKWSCSVTLLPFNGHTSKILKGAASVACPPAVVLNSLGGFDCEWPNHLCF